MKPVLAVAFDYGKVLSGPQNPSCVATMLRLTGLASGEFEACYRADRLAYDRGTLSAHDYWERLLRAAGIAATEQLIGQLSAADLESWMGTDERVIGWASHIAASGKAVAIISNMPTDVRVPLVERHSAWLARFPVRIFSCEVGCAKPDAEIYALLLKQLGVPSDRVLFIDDSATNVEGARRAGLRTIHYTSIDVLNARLLSELGLPAV